MKPFLVVPAAGPGSRLDLPLPKVLAPVAGRPMIDHLIDMYGPLVDRVILVVHPDAVVAIRSHCATVVRPVEIHVQGAPTGMLDALLIPRAAIAARAPRHVWVTWCDQVAVRPETIRTLADATDAEPAADLILPTSVREHPYIHFVRDDLGQIVDVLHRREGDAMPDHGESDIGLFSLTLATYRDRLSEYAAEDSLGAATGERNFLPFIPWLARRGTVLTFEARDPEEAIGVNTPEDRARVERYLGARMARKIDRAH